MAPNVENLTAVLFKKQDLRMEKRPVPEPKDDEVLLQMGCVGICGSDIHYLVHGECATFVVKAPMVIGHEGSGTVAKVGKNVTHLKPGDRVAIEPGVPCRNCKACCSGKYNLCPNIFFCATPPDNGNLCQYYTHNANFCYKLPDNMSLEEGAMMEPLSVGVHACNQAELKFGDNVLITGCGPIGLVSLVAAKAMGASKVIMTDIVDHRLQVALKAGADAVIDVSKGTIDDHEKQIKAALGGKLPEVTLDCTGFESSMRLAVRCTGTGGTIVLVGMGNAEMKLPLADALTREVAIKGVFRYRHCYPKAIEMVASGKANVKQFITHNFTLEQTLEAFETARSGKGNPIKVMIHCSK
ncbi:Sorbitol dehydrogenase [Frankliniella fusca]|uniref:Sorbitol dehydrogenase n=2 Tax=Arthropoda TaxID=6656 RepID=A0AAE1HW38_9NEOP|nr:Sorbitol dehydrogenase [Frankliniella fusca]